MKKLIYLSNIFLLIVLFKGLFSSNNGDPFDYISSGLSVINDSLTFAHKILQRSKIIIVFVYQNNLYGDTNNDFYHMASIYTSLAKQFSNNKNIEFYRSHMSQGISPLLLDLAAPSMQIYYEGKKIQSLPGKQTKNDLLKAIIEALRNNLKSIINENEFIEAMSE
jgi:hypothetical protein